MCGICGMVSLNDNPVPRDTLTQMNASIVHRGPDDEGYYYDSGHVGLAMRRLSIIDVCGGHQPIHNEDRSVWVVLNGEIYNYRELRHDLQARGHEFYTSSDTEVLVHLYEEHGQRFVEHLRGMFAFALYDRTQHMVLLGRDRLGKKPLYYAQQQGHVIFASEIKALLASSLLTDRLDRYALDSYLSHGFVVGDRTMFAGVQKLPAGCVLTVKDKTLEVEQYWDLPHHTESHGTEQDVALRLRELLEEAVRIRLMSEVPLGAFLSGGIDSSAVVGLMSQQLSSPVKTFSVGFGDDTIDELSHARAVAQFFGTDHHEYVITGCSPDLLKEINWYHDEPAADPAIVPTYRLSRFARQQVTVAVTGEGGDEIFGGYNHYKLYHRLLRLERYLPNLALVARGLMPFSRVAGWLGNRRLLKGLWIASLPPEARPRGWLSIFTDFEKRRLCQQGFRDSLNQNTFVATFADFQTRVNQLDYLTQAMYLDSKTQLADQLLMKVDKTTMASSLEARCPLLDHKLIEFVATLPVEMKLSGQGSKLILRKALRNLLPADILQRPKQGFEVPLRQWLQHDLAECAEEVLLKKTGVLFDYLDYHFVHKLWKTFAKTQDQLAARQIWLLLNLAIWCEEHKPCGL